MANDKLGMSPFDAAIVEGFASNKSAEEISSSAPINGVLSPAQCLSRLQKLVRSKDVLDIKDRLALALDDAYWLRTKLKNQMDNSEYIKSDEAAAFLKTLDAITTRIEKAQLGLAEHLLRFNERRAREMTEALEFIIAAVVEGLDMRGIDRSQVDEIVYEAIPQSIPEIEA